MVYSAICDRLHFDFDIGNPKEKILLLLSGIRRLDSARDQNESDMKSIVVWLNKPYKSVEWRKSGP